MLVGRDHEIGRIDHVLRQMTTGESCVLVIEGEAGTGKTSLLNLAADRADRMSVLRASGVAGADQMAFAGLVGLLRPIASMVDDLPAPQADALRVVLGLRIGRGGEPFLLGVALLGILAAASETAPVLVLVDDLQWMDAPSARALLFALRRLHADRVGALIAIRSDEPLPGGTAGQLQDLEVMPVLPLDVRGAIELLAEEHIAAPVAIELHRLTGGNPLALKETAAALTPSQRTGTTAPPDSAALPRSVRQAYVRQLAVLSANVRNALLVAAVGRLDELDLLRRALQVRGLDLTDLADAEDLRLLRIVTDVVPPRYQWKHPLVRAAILESAESLARRAAHSAQAAALGEVLDLSSKTAPSSRSRARRAARAWHLSAATVEADDRVADELAAVAADAADGRAHSAAAAAYHRAATLTVETSSRADRLALAAEAAWAAGDGAMTRDIVEHALEHASGTTQVRLVHLRGLYELWWRSSRDAVESLKHAFRLALHLDVGTAMEIAPELVWAAITAGSPDLDKSVCECVVLADSFADRQDRRQSALVTWTVHAARHLSGGRDLVRPVTTTELSAMYEDFEVLAGRELRRYAFYVLMNNMSLDLPKACAQVDPQIATLRADGEISALLKLLDVRDYAAFCLGDWDGAWRMATEVLDLAQLAGQSYNVGGALDLLGEIVALRGDEASCVRTVEARRLVAEIEIGLPDAHLDRPLALLALSLGHYEQAATRLDEVYSAVVARGWALPELAVHVPDLVEALVMSGRRADASARFRDYLEVAKTNNNDPDQRPSALVQRLHGLLAADSAEAVAAFDAALQAHAETPMDNPFQHARTRLLYGERLRRDGQRRAAREQLRKAAGTFEELRADPWARRANRELAGTGANRRPHRHGAGAELTPQELRIALLVTHGLTNKDIAAQMYLSTKTIEFHLGHIYRKLELHSRTQLAHHLTNRQT